MFTFISFQSTGDELEERNWTFIFYMGGDGQPDYISDEVMRDINNLKKSYIPSYVNIVILKDQKEDNDTRIYELNTKSLSEIPLKSVNSTWKDELDLSDPNTLKCFSTWALDQYPADHVLLNLWGHGDGIKGMPLEDNNHLKLPDIKDALSNIHVDIIGFDACGMGFFELYYQLKDNSDIIIASQTEEPIEGWPYDNIIKNMSETDDLTPKILTKIIVSEYDKWSEQHSGVSTTLTGVDTSKLPTQELEYLIDVLDKTTPYYIEKLNIAENKTERYPISSSSLDLYDLSLEVNYNIPSHELKIAGSKLRAKINKSVIIHERNQIDLDTRVDKSNGMSIYFPQDEASLDEYKKLEFAKSNWYDFLVSLDINEDGILEKKMEFSVNPGENNKGLVLTSSFDKSFSIEVLVFEDMGLIKKLTFHNSFSDFTLDLEVGEYWMDIYLSEGNITLNHTSMNVILESKFYLQGDVNSNAEVHINIFNTRSHEWRNLSIGSGGYHIELDQPSFCLPGDELEVVFQSGD
ncbi:MAG: clostripain-related cysteine peptidase, partial [Thermoplasmatota archaeon]